MRNERKISLPAEKARQVQIPQSDCAIEDQVSEGDVGVVGVCRDTPVLCA